MHTINLRNNQDWDITFNILVKKFLQLEEINRLLSLQKEFLLQTPIPNTQKVQAEQKLRPTYPVHENVPILERVKGEIYYVKGARKRWDGKRFTRCCLVDNCRKLAQGTSKFCKAHGGINSCRFRMCKNATRGGSNFCAKHKYLAKPRKARSS